ncbi:toprim domain-containing protein [Phenylobacterium sp.]|uniref:DUF7146 domain-containing protein n=1 Tax=Phenylobacterium sp. TaxID=1871053 RepID=UPI0025E874AA|nr:toprim domain-containing protein [Phenylobacterium sp.]
MQTVETERSAPDLREIVKRLGGEIHHGGRSALVPAPGHSRSDRGLSLTLTREGRLIWHAFNAGNDRATMREVFAYLGLDQRGGRPMTKAEAQRARADLERKREAERKVKLAFCRDVWGQTVPAAGSPVEAYLRGRGLIGEVPPVLRFHPTAPLGYPDPSRPDLPRYPAMVAIVTGPDGKTATGLHVTALSSDGRGKAAMRNPRRMFGDLAGGVVQLAPLPGKDGPLAVGEGIETCLAYRDLKGVATWAALSTSGLRRFSPPAGVARLIVAADSDDAPKREGMASARHLAERARRRCAVTIDAAPEGLDWGDVLEARP